uniref:Putative esterase n=1 Tax=Oryza australiensis TaxID=4532 RepID=A0A1V1H781_9ORYZ|nr:putative esterase [Oryza australiensis]
MARRGGALAAVVDGVLVCWLCWCAVQPALAGGGGDGGKRCKYNAMFVFGDSLADTGNICVNKSAAATLLLTFAQPPYGMTYFGHPTCRCSDGRLVVDFLGTHIHVHARRRASIADSKIILIANAAQELGLPLLPPSKRSGGDFRRGANMAIVGATALDFDFLKSIGLGYPIWNNGAMNVQLQWFHHLLPSICATQPQGCRAYLSKSLFMFGSLGGNDYNAMLFFGFTVDQARNYTPKIVDTIITGKLIAMGAAEIVVPGVMPVGCFPLYLTMLRSSNKSDYDEHGCLRPLNELSIYHNTLLQGRLAGLQARYRAASAPAPVRIMYADYYTMVAQMLHTPARFVDMMGGNGGYGGGIAGFRSGITACCGAGGGEYNYEFEARCGMKGAAACRDPSSHVCWDGVHTTEAANRLIAGGWLGGPYCHPPILH